MENPGNRSGESVGPVEDPPPPVTSGQDQSTSESLLDSSGRQQQERRPPPPLSPLTGCYLLIIVGEPHSERHKEIILQKIAKAFLSWDVNECHVSLEKELQAINGQSPEGEEARYGERLIQYATENLVTEILIHPQLNTLHQCMKNLLSSFTKHRHVIHAGYTFAGNGSWILQDGTLSISDLVEALHEPEVLRVLKAYENSVSIDVHCAAEGDWNTERFQKEPVSKLCNIRVNPGDVMTSGNLAISGFIEYLSPFLEPANIQQLLQPTDVVGNIRFTHPTLYVFPGGQGDAALFGINGFNMLIDGGFARKACFWDFARHLDRLDAVLLTRLNNSTVNGISAVLQRKKMNHVYPQIGHFFCNLQDRKIALSPDEDKDKDSLIVNLAEEGQEIVANLRHLALKPHPCYRDGNQVDPVNLYHKVGHGKLDMYVISPARDSQAVKDFLAKWSSNDGQLFSNTGKKIAGKAFEFPLQNLVSICALLVWQPANPNDTITRILFPGSTPQHKIFEGLEKLRHLEFLKHPVCSARSISPSASTVTVTRSASKTRQVKPADNKQKEMKLTGKPQAKPVKQKPEKTLPKDAKPKPDTNKLVEEKKESENSVEETVKKLDNRLLSKDEQIENIKKEIQKIEQAENEEQKKKVFHRSKYDMRNVKSKVDSRAPSKSIDRKKIPEKKIEGEGSPPITPKKAVTNGVATKAEKSKAGLKPVKTSSPSSTPAKSAKEANNRKVVEARVTSRSSSKSTAKKKEETPPFAPPPLPTTTTTTTTTSSTAKTERKQPISRRPKSNLSPAKTVTVRTKPDSEILPKKVEKKAETVEATVKLICQKATEGLGKSAETEKTELEKEEGIKIELKKLEPETTENKETDTRKAVKKQLESVQSQESTKSKEEEEEEEEAEEEEEEEYLIITKEESTEESVKGDESGRDNDSVQEEIQTKDETEGEGEMKKLLREEEESEKKREESKEIIDNVETNAGKSEGFVEKPTEILDDDEKEEKGEEDVGETHEEKGEKEPEKDEKKTEEKADGEDKREEKGLESPERRESELQKLTDVDEGIDLKEPASKEHKEGESLPEEKISNTVETSATTAPTLPEDERIEEPIREIKEVVEEKYIQEETKEEKQKEPVEPETKQLTTLQNIDVEGTVPTIQTAQKKLHPRDVVKTPDEVADLPMHEEVDPRTYSCGEFAKELQKGSEEIAAVKKMNLKSAIKGEANLLEDEDEPVESPDLKKVSEEPEIKETADSLTSKYLNIIDRLEQTGTEPKNYLSKQPGETTVLKETPEPEVPLSKFAEESGYEKEQKTKEEIAEDTVIETDVDEVVPEVKRDEVDKELEALVTGKKQISGKTSPQDLCKERLDKLSSGKNSPDTSKEVPGKTEPTDLKGKFSPEEKSKDVSGRTTPQESSKQKEGKELKEGKVTPEKKDSGKSTPSDTEKNGTERVDVQKEGFEKSSPQSLAEEKEEENWSAEKSFEKELGQKINLLEESKDSEKEIPETSKQFAGKVSPVESVEDGSGKSTPSVLPKDSIEKTGVPDYEISGKSTPLEQIREISGKSTPQDLDKSGIVTLNDAEKGVSGRSSPLQNSEKEISGKSTPHDLEKKFPSGIGTTQDFENKLSVTEVETEKLITSEELVAKDSLEETYKETYERTVEESSKDIPVEEKISTVDEVSKTASLYTLDEDTISKDSKVPGGQAPLEDVSKKSTEQPEKKLFRKSSPVREDSSLTVTREPSKEPEKESRIQELEKPSSGNSGKVSPEDKDDKDVSGKGTPHDFAEEISQKSSLHEENSEKPLSGMSTPQDWGKELSGKSTPRMETSGKSTPCDSGKEYLSRKSSLISIGGKDGVYEMEKEKMLEKDTDGTHVSDNPKEDVEKDEDGDPLGKGQLQEKDVSGKSTPFSTDRELSGKVSPAPGGKVTSDSVSLALADKGTSGTYSLEKESSVKSSSPSPVDVSPLSLDEIKEMKEDTLKGKQETDYENQNVVESEIRRPSIRASGESRKSVAESVAHIPCKSQDLERVKYDGGELSGTSTPDRSHHEKSDASLPNGVESEEELEKGILESERQEKESQILDISSGEEEELKALGDDEEDSDGEIKRERCDLETGIISTPGPEDSRKDIAKGQKDDINKLVKIGGGMGSTTAVAAEAATVAVAGETEEDPDSDNKTGVKRMLVTASSEDGGTETEICLQAGIKIMKDEVTTDENLKVGDEEEFSNLILEARKEYNIQRSRKTSYNSSAEEVEEAQSVVFEGRNEEEEDDEEEGEEGEEEEEEEELGTLLMQARRELAFVRSRSRESKEKSSSPASEGRTLEKTKMTTRSETTRTDDNDIITITTILTEEREEQEDGSIKVITTKETTTKGGKDEGTVVTVDTNIETKKDEEGDVSFEIGRGSTPDLCIDRRAAPKRGSKEDIEGKASHGGSRRTSASSIISQEDLVSRKDSAKMDDFRQSSSEMSPLKTTYITSHGDSESLMTSSFYGNLPTEDEMIGKHEHAKEFRKGRGYESFTEIGPNGERTERTYFYGTEEDPGRSGREKSRFVKAYYTDDGHQKSSSLRYHTSDIPEEEGITESSQFVQHFYSEEASETGDKFRFVETFLSSERAENVDFAKAVDEHISARGECLLKEIQQDTIRYSNGKSKTEESGGTSSTGSKPEEEKKKDIIEDWGKPLGLPLPPKNNKTYPFPGQNISTTSSLSTPTDNSDSVTNWGQPMSLPSPAPPPAQNGVVEPLTGKTGNSAKETPKKERKVQAKKNISGDNKSSGNNTPNRRSESPVKQTERRAPSTGRSNKRTSGSHLYLDLTYVPHHGNSYYSNVEFFKKVRARYYVFSGTEPSKEVYNALLEAKQTWEDKKLEVTIIPTYDTDVLGYWVAENEEILAKHKIDLSPSASRCTINLQDHETSCSAYRLEF